ncbi:MAG: glycosyltransferase family 4 protein [Verrucomicrobia bacterium]|jgi:glycosyltransferase involved in cell wall biosynthesis|nr:glycosyltransferase family 4 protein [Verrucomicrobiota bacterium]
MVADPLTVAWFSYFPVEWLSGVPAPVTRLPRQHPASWQRVLLAEFEKNPALRLHVVVLRKQFERDLTFVRNGVTFHLVKTPGGLRAPSLFWVDTVLIRRVLRAIRPDVVHAWGTEQGAALVAERLGYPRVTTIQGLISWYSKVSPPSWHERVAGFLENYALRRVPLVTTEARFSVQYLRHRFPRLHVEQVEHAPDPVFHSVVRRPQTTPLRFIFVGAFDHRKGGDVMLQALDRLRGEIDFELLVVGKPRGTFLQTLQAGVSPEFWRRIIFKDQLTHREVAQELSTATMMLCPSRADVSPNAVKEAVVAGVPVIGTAVGGIPDYVFPGQNGRLCSPGNLAELMEAIRAACGHPLFGVGRVEPKSLAQTRAYLSPELMARRFMEVYQQALANPEA